MDDSFTPEIPVIKPILTNFDEIESVDQMNEILKLIGGFLVADKP